MERDADRTQGPLFREGLATVRERVADFVPDLVVVFGGDHRRAFRTIVPTFSISLSAGIQAEGGHPAERMDVPSLARDLAEQVIAREFDVTVCRDLELDHAFAQPLREFLGRVDAVPVIPIGVNCATPPLPTGRRVLEFGTAVADVLDQHAGRVLVIGSGGLSHSPPSLEVDTYDLSDAERARLIADGAAAAREKIRPKWDQAFLRAMSEWDEQTLAEMTDGATEAAGVGANEVRTWLAAGASGRGHLDCIAYEPVPEWITGMGIMATV